jgi:2-phosphoglycerate kinase
MILSSDFKNKDNHVLIKFYEVFRECQKISESKYKERFEKIKSLLKYFENEDEMHNYLMSKNNKSDISTIITFGMFTIVCEMSQRFYDENKI